MLEGKFYVDRCIQFCVLLCTLCIESWLPFTNANFDNQYESMCSLALYRPCKFQSLFIGKGFSSTSWVSESVFIVYWDLFSCPRVYEVGCSLKDSGCTHREVIGTYGFSWVTQLPTRAAARYLMWSAWLQSPSLYVYVLGTQSETSQSE